ncbi:beta-ketoacyl synthase chain length factor [Pasteurella sp. PK-2025]|uniref:beta-ketoacyl synthase chain length factor n=1 Tax=unclassified Pasteurella TaxID=2621516 RepID=UPI003C743683
MLTFHIAKLKAYSATLTDEAQWHTWANQPFQPLETGAKFATPLIPMMQARRMGLADKMGIQLALELNQDAEIDFVVFASRHGQLSRTYKLLDHFFRHGDMSPTDFATAVHNAPAGQFSILAKQTAPISSIAAEENTFCSAMLEALLALKNGKKAVLLVFFDDQVPDFYKQDLPQHEQSAAYAVGMILTAGDSWKLSFTTGNTPNPACPQGLAFLQAYFRQEPHFSLHYEQQQWQFLRN